MVLQRDCNFCKQCITERCWRASQALCWHSMEQVESLVRVPCMADTCDQDVPQWCTAEGLTGGTLPSYRRGWHLCCTASGGTQVLQKTIQKTDGFWGVAQKKNSGNPKNEGYPQNSWNKSMIYSWISTSSVLTELLCGIFVDINLNCAFSEIPEGSTCKMKRGYTSALVKCSGTRWFPGSTIRLMIHDSLSMLPEHKSMEDYPKMVAMSLF